MRSVRPTLDDNQLWSHKKNCTSKYFCCEYLYWRIKYVSLLLLQWGTRNIKMSTCFRIVRITSLKFSQSWVGNYLYLEYLLVAMIAKITHFRWCGLFLASSWLKNCLSGVGTLHPAGTPPSQCGFTHEWHKWNLPSDSNWQALSSLDISIIFAKRKCPSHPLKSYLGQPTKQPQARKNIWAHKLQHKTWHNTNKTAQLESPHFFALQSLITDHQVAITLTTAEMYIFLISIFSNIQRNI